MRHKSNWLSYATEKRCNRRASTRRAITAGKDLKKKDRRLMTDSEIIAELKREPAAELRRLQTMANGESLIGAKIEAHRDLITKK